MSVEELALAAWPASVGKSIAAHTRAVRMVRDRLVVEVEDAIWQRQLHFLTHQILRNLEKDLGEGLVRDLEFRVVPRRIEPQRARQAGRLVLPDEADAIADPVLRSIYRASRKKALA
jgi:predicted nucleic acid-binding Zn ribbon protein